MISREERARAREEGREYQKAITEGWKAVAAEHPYLLEDLNNFVNGLTASYRRWAEDQAIGDTPIDDHKVSSLLQQARACDIVRTYITSRIDQDVAQPIKNSK